MQGSPAMENILLDYRPFSSNETFQIVLKLSGEKMEVEGEMRC